MEIENNPYGAINELLAKVENKDLTLFFYTLDAKNYPLASQYEIFKHAQIMQNAGYKTCVVMDDSENQDEMESLKSRLDALLKDKKSLKGDQKTRADEQIDEIRAKIRSLKNPYPKWMGKDFKDVNLKLLSELNKNTKVSPVDIFVIPEVFKDVAYQLVKSGINTKNVMFVQDLTRFFTVSVQDLSYVGDLKISNFIVTTDYAKNLIEDSLRVDGKILKYHVLPPTIPNYFKPKKLKKPKVVILSRNSEDTKLFHKTFIERHPELKWIPFENLGNTPRKIFAEKVAESAVGVMLDRRATYGTFPMECVKSHTYPVILESDYDLDYTQENDDNAFVLSSNRIFDIAREGSDGKFRNYDVVEGVYRQIMLFLDGYDSNDYFEKIISHNMGVNDDKAKSDSVVNVYEKIIQERKSDIEAQKKQMQKNDEQ